MAREIEAGCFKGKHEIEFWNRDCQIAPCGRCGIMVVQRKRAGARFEYASTWERFEIQRAKIPAKLPEAGVVSVGISARSTLPTYRGGLKPAGGVKLRRSGKGVVRKGGRGRKR